MFFSGLLLNHIVCLQATSFYLVMLRCVVFAHLMLNNIMCLQATCSTILCVSCRPLAEPYCVLAGHQFDRIILGDIVPLCIAYN